MSQIVYTHAPNKLPATYALGDTNWWLLGFNSSGAPTAYATYAALKAAGGRAYPGLGWGGNIASCLIRTVTSAGAAGSAAYYALNRTAPPTSTNPDNVVGGSNQQISLSVPFQSIWVALTAGTDSVILDGAY